MMFLLFSRPFFSLATLSIVRRFDISFNKHIQHDVPPGKHALITVKQPKGNLIWIQTLTSPTTGNKKKGDKNEFKPRLTTWDDCEGIQVHE